MAHNDNDDAVSFTVSPRYHLVLLPTCNRLRSGLLCNSQNHKFTAFKVQIPMHALYARASNYRSKSELKCQFNYGLGQTVMEAHEKLSCCVKKSSPETRDG